MDYTKFSNQASKTIEKTENIDYNLEYVDLPEAKVPFAKYYNEHILPFIIEGEGKIKAEEEKTKDKNTLALNIKRTLIRLNDQPIAAIFFIIFTIILFILLFALFYATAAITTLSLEPFKIDRGFIIYTFFTVPTVGFCVAAYTAYTYKPDVVHSVERFKLHSDALSKAFRFILPDIQELDKSPISAKELEPFCALEGDYYFEKQENTYNYKKGNYRNASFEIYEHIEYSKDPEALELLSEHLFIVLNTNKPFNDSAIIIDRKIDSNGWTKGEELDHLQPISLEGSHFDKKATGKKFNVYSSDKEEVTKLLNSRFMDAVLKLNDLFADGLSQVSYNKDRIVFIIERHGLIIRKKNTSTNYIKDIQILFKQMDIIFETLDILEKEQTGI
jgi:hypothetical protein